MKKEIFRVEKNEFDDYTKTNGSWIIQGKKYNFYDTFLTEGDGEWHSVIVIREEDGKFFKYDWGYDGGEYYYEPEWVEVKPKIVSKTIYI